MRPGLPRVTIGIIAVNALVYLYALSNGVSETFVRYGLWPKAHASGLDQVDPIYSDGLDRWITSGFVHLGLLHIGLNMFVLYRFGQPVEQLIGRGRFALIYAVSLLGGSAFVAQFGEAGSVHGGASGAIYGVLGAYIVMSIRLRLPVQFLIVQAGLWLVISFAYASNISWQGHLGGAIAGSLTMMALLATQPRGPRQAAT